MDDQPNSNPPKPKPDPNPGSLRSPIRPRSPEQPDLLAGKVIPRPASPRSNPQPESPQAALDLLRGKMEAVADEFSQGKINRAQFNAIYKRYSEQRTVVERIIARNPDNEAWKQAAASGHTSFLRDHFESRLLYYLVYQHQIATPLMMGGKQQPNMDQVGQVLKSLWKMPSRPKIGLARKDLGNGHWIVLALGEHAVTVTLYMLEPSTAQINLVRDLHADFERANRSALERGTRSLDRFVFPQRALAEK